MKKWTKEQSDYLKQIYIGKSNEEITNIINQKFDTNYSICAVGCKKNKIGCKSEYRKKPRIWTEEIIAFMIENYKGKDNIELAKLVNKKFGLNTNGDKIANVKANLKRRKGIDLRTGINKGYFKKGDIPVNKGKTWNEYMSEQGQINSRKTTFKKGNVPDNYRNIGSERINKDGYIEIKVKNPNIWQLKHRYIYENKYGSIPKGHKVIFLDGNKQNLDISNLALVSNTEELILNKRNLRTIDRKTTEAGINVVKLIIKTSEIKKKQIKGGLIK